MHTAADTSTSPETTPPSPETTPSQSQAQPQFTQMIIAAIKAQKQSNRSRARANRREISKYITKTYTDLPSNHRRLLTFHLEKMTAEGSLKMDIESLNIDRQFYFLPATSPGSNPIAESPKNLSTPSVGPKQKPGLKPKPKNTSQPGNVANCTPKIEPGDETILMSDEPRPDQEKPITPTKSNVSGGQETQRDAKNVFVSAGMMSGPSASPTPKRGRGKPARPKTDVGPNAGPVAGHVAVEETKRRRSLSGKPLGRPKKVGRSSNMDTSVQLQPPPITQELIHTRGERGGDREISYQGVLEDSHL